MNPIKNRSELKE